MEKHFWLVMVLAMVAVFAFACGDDDSSGGSDADTDSDSDTDTDTDTDGTLTLTAATADGPCGPGSIYFISELSTSTFQQVSLVSGSTDSLGRITGLSLKSNTPYEMWVQCYDFNEITGSLSDSEVTLFNFLVTGEGSTDPDAGPDSIQPGNITDVSHILSTYIKNTYIASNVQNHETYESIKNTAFLDFIGQLSFLVPSAEANDCDVNELTIIAGSSPCNDIALAIELVIRNYAVKTAETEGQPQTAFLQNTLNGLKFAFEDGVLATGSEDDLIAKITASVPTLDVSGAVENLVNYLTPLGGEAPNPDNCFDWDDDGIPNADDPDIDGDGIMNADDEEPYNPNVGGGMYFDSDSGLSWQNVPVNAQISWDSAVIYCDDLVLGSHEDWRMPSISELRSLIRGCTDTETNGGCGVTDSCFDENCYTDNCSCADLGDFCYWPSDIGGECWQFVWSSVKANVTTPWMVDFRMAEIILNDFHEPAWIRCVRTM